MAATTPQLKQYSSLPSREQMDALACWVVLIADHDPALWEQLPYGELLQRRCLSLPTAQREHNALGLDLPNSRLTLVRYAVIAPAISAFKLLTLARQLARPLFGSGATAVGLLSIGFIDEDRERLTETLLSAVLAGTAELPKYKKTTQEQARLEHIELYNVSGEHAFERGFAAAAGNNLARYLTCLPTNYLTPKLYRERVAALAETHGWQLEFSDMDALKYKGAGAFLAVARGSSDADAGIVHLTYQPANSSGQRRLALVGKGICFDTGGVNLKSSRHMLGMHGDMQGSAVALGVLLALTRLKVDFTIDCWLAIAANNIGPAAYHPNEVVTALNGTTIEIIDTDAEGRMVLADTLALASALKPGLILDYATLTGACVRALGTAYSGVFTNRPALWPCLIETGQKTGERVWPFPLDEDYDENLESPVADTRQCAAEGPADHILAARFLSRFVDQEIPWVHLDLSSSENKGGLAHIPSEVTGFGVRFSLGLVLDEGIF